MLEFFGETCSSSPDVPFVVGGWISTSLSSPDVFLGISTVLVASSSTELGLLLELRTEIGNIDETNL